MAIKAGEQISALDFTGWIVMYGSATPPAYWLTCDGSAISRTTYSDLFSVIGTGYGIGDGSTTFNLPDMKARFPIGYSDSAPTKIFTFSSRSSNTITVTGVSNTNNNHIQTGQAVLYSAPSGAMTGLTHNTTYYLKSVAYNQFTLATSVANANAGTTISLSSDGTGTQTFTATFSARAIGDMGGEENHALTDAEMPSHAHDVQSPVLSGSASNQIPLRDNDGVSEGWWDTNPVINKQDTSNTDELRMMNEGSDAVHNNLPPYTVVNYIIKT